MHVSGLVWALFVNSAGILADGYDLFVVDIIIAILTVMHPDEIGAREKGIMASVTYAGIITGMVSLGLTADVIGHRAAGMLTAALATLGCVSAACCTYMDNFNIAYQLALCRFVLGMGIGGEYPVSMTLGSGKKTGNLFHNAGFHLSPEQILLFNMVLFQVGGTLAPAFGSILLKAGLPLSAIWRILILCGLLPAVGAFIARALMPGHSVENSVEEVDPCRSASTGALTSWASARTLVRGIGWRFPILFGCCLTWALHNFVYFGQGSFRSLMDQRMFGGGHEGRAALQHHAHFGLFMSLFGLLMAIIILVVVNKVSLFWTQLGLFVAFSLLAGLCSLVNGQEYGSDRLLFALMCLWSMPLSGAGIICYVLPTQQFPARVHATCCGIAAASAKVGALVGTALFPIIEQAYGLSILLLVSCLVGLAGAIATAMLTPRHPPDASDFEESKPLTN
mmetsp:Transcript_25016/g.56756  ORF Transcript_25016/g.56756 Transcript_25016/m.56756 type:complete len:451 (-) Transcript_25016:176-1528(-)